MTSSEERIPTTEELTGAIIGLVGNVDYLRDLLAVVKKMDPEEKRWMFKLLKDAKARMDAIAYKKENMPWWV